MSVMSKEHFKQTDTILVSETSHFPEARLFVTTYVQGSAVAVLGLDLKTNEVIWTASINLLDTPPQQGGAWIRGDDLITEILHELVRKEVLDFTGRFEKYEGNLLPDYYVYECRVTV